MKKKKDPSASQKTTASGRNTAGVRGFDAEKKNDRRVKSKNASGGKLDSKYRLEHCRRTKIQSNNGIHLRSSAYVKKSPSTG